MREPSHSRAFPTPGSLLRWLVDGGWWFVVETGSVIELTIEKAAAGGRMLARHQGQVVLVWGAIPGERVEARVERTGKGVVYADTEQVLSASDDRRPASGDWRC